METELEPGYHLHYDLFMVRKIKFLTLQNEIYQNTVFWKNNQKFKEF